jgi:hypothetical protein
MVNSRQHGQPKNQSLIGGEGEQSIISAPAGANPATQPFCFFSLRDIYSYAPANVMPKIKIHIEIFSAVVCE